MDVVGCLYNMLGMCCCWIGEHLTGAVGVVKGRGKCFLVAEKVLLYRGGAGVLGKELEMAWKCEAV